MHCPYNNIDCPFFCFPRHTSAALGTRGLRGAYTPRSALRLFNYREISFRQAKNRRKICVCAIFVVPL